ncbi:unnamed protein product [Lupinus luteus]|uniref:Uncharacterized protein n=1 Tax=Lupinus luteus TaxID=3873 RepID=A0AAV1W4F1_LUPLU
MSLLWIQHSFCDKPSNTSRKCRCSSFPGNQSYYSLANCSKSCHVSKSYSLNHEAGFPIQEWHQKFNLAYADISRNIEVKQLLMQQEEGKLTANKVAYLPCSCNDVMRTEKLNGEKCDGETSDILALAMHKFHSSNDQDEVSFN